MESYFRFGEIEECLQSWKTFLAINSLACIWAMSESRSVSSNNVCHVAIIPYINVVLQPQVGQCRQLHWCLLVGQVLLVV